VQLLPDIFSVTKDRWPDKMDGAVFPSAIHNQTRQLPYKNTRIGHENAN
jgi:hypothetical protein